MMTIIGIDPGKSGAIVSIDENGWIHKSVMPLINKEVDLHELVALLWQYANKEPCFYIEDVHAIFGSAAGSTFSFGFVCGAIQSAVASMRVPYTLVQPKVWQKEMYQGVPVIRKPSIKIKNGKRIGQTTKGKRDTKKMSLLAAKRLFPTVDLRKNESCRMPHDGIVDALLIAEYGRRATK